MHLYRIDFYIKSFFYRETRFFRSVEMFKKNLNAQGFHPRRLGSPKNAITLEQVLRHHRSKRRGGRGDRHCPLLHLTCALYFIS